MTRTRRWAPVIFGVAVFLVFLAISAAVFGVSWVRDHLEIEETSPQRADATFEDIRQRFIAKAPLLEMQGADRIRRNPPPDTAPRVSLTTMHLLAWDEGQRELVRFELPFWLLRLRDTPIRFGNYASGLDELNISLTAAEIERYGPGVIIDVSREGRKRALIWVE